MIKVIKVKNCGKVMAIIFQLLSPLGCIQILGEVNFSIPFGPDNGIYIVTLKESGRNS